MTSEIERGGPRLLFSLSASISLYDRKVLLKILQIKLSI